MASFLVPLGVLLTILGIQSTLRHIVPETSDQKSQPRGRKARQQRRRADGGSNQPPAVEPEPKERWEFYRTYAVLILAWIALTLLLARLFDTAALAIIALSLVAGIGILLWWGNYSEPLPLVLGVVGLAAFLVLASEVFYVKDFYGPPNMRMNTVFKPLLPDLDAPRSGDGFRHLLRENLAAGEAAPVELGISRRHYLACPQRTLLQSPHCSHLCIISTRAADLGRHQVLRPRSCR